MAFKIVDGPSKFELMVSLFHGNSHRRPQNNVTFRITAPLATHCCVQIDEISREDGSGECWNFCGYAEGIRAEARLIKGFYSTRTRKGTFEVVER